MGVGFPLTFGRTAATMSELSDGEDQLRERLASMSASQRRRLRDALDGVHSDADYFAKHKLHYRDPRTVGIFSKVTEILAIDWDDPQRVVRLLDEMDGSDG
jgi:hypothetical protein